jgi:hypothetical protein
MMCVMAMPAKEDGLLANTSGSISTSCSILAAGTTGLIGVAISYDNSWSDEVK